MTRHDRLAMIMAHIVAAWTSRHGIPSAHETASLVAGAVRIAMEIDACAEANVTGVHPVTDALHAELSQPPPTSEGE